MTLLDGKKVSSEILNNIKEEIKNNNYIINFAIILIGDDEASNIYVNHKIKKCQEVGINVKLYHLDANVTEEYVLNLIDTLNKDKSINGILLQSPVPEHIDIINCFNKIDYKKDIDGFSNISVGNLYLGKYSLSSCTPKGIIKLLDYYNIDLEGKSVCIINRSNIVGKPLLHLLLQRNATVTICHSKTKNIDSFTKIADIVICAVGIPKFITKDMIKESAIVIDVGITRVNGHVVGDVDFDNVKDVASYITPVPGGIGPMTIAMVINNIVETVRKNG